MPTRRGSESFEWGPKIEAQRLEDLYAPQEVKPFTIAPPGIDNLGLEATDVFFIPGRGEFEVSFKGYLRVARAEPTSPDWDTATVYVNLVGLYLEGEAEGLGPIRVRANPDRLSAGLTLGPALTGGQSGGVAKCRIATAATFESPAFGSTIFNKEPILLMNDGIEAIPPIEDPNGEAFIYYLPLFHSERPDQEPVAFLQRLRYTVGNYLTENDARAFRQAEEGRS
jgi:hypothetical protein